MKGLFSSTSTPLQMLPSLDGLIIGEAEAVGVKYVPPTASCPPLRLFYPAKLVKQSNNVDNKSWRWYQDDSPIAADKYLCGLLVVTGVSPGTWKFALLSRVLRWMSFFLPLRFRALPDTYANLDIDATKKLPVIVFSHGLTGTSQENALLCAAWAKQGYIVVAVHHQDGSSACVPMADKTLQWYNRGPKINKDYDESFRPRQVQKRAKEMCYAVEYLQSPQNSFTQHCNFEKMAAAGFSYGAATAALVAVQDNSPFRNAALILLDGWFYIDVAESAQIEFEFPSLAFERCNSIHQRPALLLNSSEFASYNKLWQATGRLAGDVHTPLVLPGTRHNNFCELCFWMPSLLLTYVGAIGRGEPNGNNPKDVYREIITRTSQFLKEALR